MTDINTPAPWRRVWPFLLPLVLLYVIYGSIFIHDSSFVVDGKRVFCLLDDPMISMRYARNLADGLGLVWNAGERVEGITNPGWTFIMALVHLVEHDRTKTSLYMHVISLLCNVVTVILTALLGLKLSGGGRAVAVGAAALTAFYYPANYWSLYGMETGLLAMLITLAVWLYLRPQPRADWPVYLVMGLATIVRFDAVVSLLVIGGYAILTAADWPGRRRHALLLAATLLVFIGGQTIARLMYYGYPLPNTYYLKMTGFPVLQRMARGAYVTGVTAWYLLWPLVAAGAVALLTIIIRRRTFIPPKPNLTRLPSVLLNPLILFALLALAQFAYSVYVGGDAWENEIYCNRYVIVAHPALAIILAFGLAGIVNFVTRTDQRFWKVVLLVLVLVEINIWSASPPNVSSMIGLETDAPIQINSRTSYEIYQFITVRKDAHRVCSDWAGGTPYFLDCYAIDPLGKCDVQIAHMEVPKSHWASLFWDNAFYPGHMKWDMVYTSKMKNPDYAIFRFGPLLKSSREVVLSSYNRVYFYDQDIYICKSATD